MKIGFYFTLLAISLLSTAPDSKACDACGCAMGGSYSGIFPQFSKSLVGARYQYRSFAHPSTAENYNGSSKVLTDEFQTIETWARLYPHSRIQVFFFVPYSVHTRTESMRTTTIQSIGDMRITAKYMVFDTGDSLDRDLKHTLLVGAGARLPTGKYMQRDENRTMLPAQFQTGTGSFAVSASVNYTIRYKKLGLNVDGSLQLNATNELTYQFGANQSVAANAFYWYQPAKVAWLPNAGLAYENYDRDKEYGYENIRTGGSLILLNTGLDVYFNRLYVQLFMQKPLEQNLPHSQPAGKIRLSAGLSFLF
jgi:hypothetical protein